MTETCSKCTSCNLERRHNHQLHISWRENGGTHLLDLPHLDGITIGIHCALVREYFERRFGAK